MAEKNDKNKKILGQNNNKPFKNDQSFNSEEFKTPDTSFDGE